MYYYFSILVIVNAVNVVDLNPRNTLMTGEPTGRIQSRMESKTRRGHGTCCLIVVQNVSSFDNLLVVTIQSGFN